MTAFLLYCVVALLGLTALGLVFCILCWAAILISKD